MTSGIWFAGIFKIVRGRVSEDISDDEVREAMYEVLNTYPKDPSQSELNTCPIRTLVDLEQFIEAVKKRQK